MEIIGIITYTDELTVNLAIESLRSQPVDFKEIILLDNVSPMRTAFNTALDYCQEICDNAFLLAADTILDANVLPLLLDKINDETFMVNGWGRDIFFGDHGSGGFFLWNMNVWEGWRYGKGQTADGDLVTHIENETALSRFKVPSIVSTHHPIWTPKEMFGRIRFTLPKYIGSPQWIEVYRDFFERETERLPQNITLKVGYDLFKTMIEDLKSWVMDDKDSGFINKAYGKFFCSKRGYPALDGEEFYAMQGWEEIAKGILSGKIVGLKPPGLKIIRGDDV